MSKPIRLGIVSPNPALRAGLRSLLGATPLSNISGAAPYLAFEAASLADFSIADFQAAPFTAVDVLILAAAPVSSSALNHTLAETGERLAVLLLTDDLQDAQNALRSLLKLPVRAWGILALDSSAEELQAAINALHEGLLVGAPALLQPAFTRFVSTTFSNANPENHATEALTERESQVIQLLARGLANKQIAVALKISEHTVKFHISSIYTKLGVTNRAEAIRNGIQQGLIIL